MIAMAKLGFPKRSANTAPIIPLCWRGQGEFGGNPNAGVGESKVIKE